MENPKKVLILTAPFGSGHLQVSSSLTEEFLKHNNVVVEEYDLYSEEFPTLSKTLQKAYLKTIVCFITDQAMQFMIHSKLRY